MDNNNLDRPAVIAAAAGSGTAAVIIFALMPVIVGGMAEQFSLDDLQSGLIATLYFSTYAGVALSSPLWVRRFDWRLMTLLGFMIMLSSIAVGLMSNSLAVARLAIASSGIGAGLLFPVSLTLVSDMLHTERVYSLKLSVEQLVPAGLLLLLSTGWLLAADLDGALLAILVTLFVCAVASLGMPATGLGDDEMPGAPGGRLLNGLLALLALGVSFAGFAGLWVFLERIAVDNGFGAGFTSRWLAVGLITSGVGPLIAAWVADRFGVVLPLLLGSAVALAAVGLMYSGITETVYALVLCLLPLGYYFALSYFFAVVAAADSNGKIAGLMSFTLAVGAASGPAIVGAVRSGGGPLLAVVALCIFIGAALMVYIARGQSASR